MKQVLVVDDEPHIQEIIGMALEEEGYSVLFASSTRSMLELLEKEQPDLILLDLLMSDSNGTEALDALRSQPHVQHIPVVVVSTGVGYRRLDAPEIPFLEKPFTLEHLLEVAHDTIGSAEEQA